MNRKTLCIAFLGLATLFVYSQEKVIVAGFPEKNFRTYWKPIEKYAKKNDVSKDKVDDLFREQLLSNISSTDDKFTFQLIQQVDLPVFRYCSYSNLKNIRDKEYYGISNLQRHKEFKELMKKYNADYMIHFTRYEIDMTMTISMSTKVIHRIDYQIFDKNLNIVSADKFKLSGISAGSLKPENFAYKYQTLGNKLSKRLYIDLAKIDKEKQLAIQDSQLDTNKVSKDIKIYEPKHGIGLSAGWGVAYGYGVEYSHLLSNHFDINIGAGFSFSGLRTGLGSRFYFKKEGSSPFLGTNFIYTTGLSNYNVSVNGVSGAYKNFSDQAVFFRGGYKIEQYNKSHMITLGYGLPFNNKGAEYISGSSSSSVQGFADMQALGGIEISYTLIFKLGE
jgi:hypothetical protein